MDIKDIEAARVRIEGVVHRTPIERSSTFSKMTGAEIYLKAENLQKAGAFKVRGAYNKMAKLIEEGEKPESVIAASAGNHAQGVAYSATTLGIKSTIVMPHTTPIAKISATRDYGAEVVLHGDVFDDAGERAKEIQAETGAVFVHAFNDPDIVAGQGTIGLEILEDVPDADVVIIPAGGGGLLAGVGTAIKAKNPGVRIVGVQARGADAVCQSFECGTGEVIGRERIDTMAEGIAIKVPGDITIPLICEHVDEMVCVTDEEMAQTVMLLLERAKLLVEPAGAASLAAILTKKIDVTNKKVVCVLSGGNVDISVVQRIITKGLVARSRMIRFTCIISDKPGGLAQFLDLVSKEGANIISVYHDRLSEDLGLHETKIEVSCEVAGEEDKEKLLTAIGSAGYIICESSRG